MSVARVTCVPEQPAFANTSERAAWQAVRDTLPAGSVLFANLRVTDRQQDHEADLVAAIPGVGLAVVEVKGGSTRYDRGVWTITRHGREVPIHPVEQARGARYALRDYVRRDPRWGSRRTRWQHFIALPFTALSDDFALPDCPRWMVLDRQQLPTAASVLIEGLHGQQSPVEPPTAADVDLLRDILAGRPQPMATLVDQAAEREDLVERLTEQQGVILDAIRLLHRVEIRGGAGSGKTWLALEQARRLSRAGQRVALMCYSRGLSAYLQRRCATWKHTERPAYVGTFHGLGQRWGAAPGSDDDSSYWEERLPTEMADLARALPPGQRYDAVVVDEAQDFADAWWTPLLAGLRDEETSGVYVFNDEGQQVFSRYGRVPLPLVPIVLDTNLRNTRPIAESFRPLAPIRMRVSPHDGPPVRFVACATRDALAAADDAVEDLLGDWSPADVALLTTGSRHPEQAARQAAGQDRYWESFWGDEQVFYGHVLGFKGLERRAVVLAVNETADRDRARERLYVGLSRARDQLVVCGDPDQLRRIGGPEVARRIGL